MAWTTVSVAAFSGCRPPLTDRERHARLGHVAGVGEPEARIKR